MATLTINTTAGQDARIAPAIGERLGLIGNASAAQVKQYLIQHIKDVVEDYEYRANAIGFAFNDFTPT